MDFASSSIGVGTAFIPSLEKEGSSACFSIKPEAALQQPGFDQQSQINYYYK